MTKPALTVLLLAALVSSLSIRAQVAKGLTYTLESGTTFSSGTHAPLWLSANKQGLSSISKDNGYFTAGIFRPMDIDTDKRFSYAFGLQLAGAYNFTSSFIVQQAYVDLKYRSITFSLGSKNLVPEFVNPTLSSGALTLSGNARPIPQLWIGLADYLAVPHTNGWLSFRGHIAYGRFTDGKWQKDFSTPNAKRTEDVLYHSKAFYFKVGNEQQFPVNFQAGLQMETEFGGKQYVNGNLTRLPSKFKDYLKIIIPLAGGSDSPVSDQLNIEGNIVGSWHASLAYHPGDWKFRAYYEHYFEDHSMLAFGYPWRDGLIGLEVTLPQNPVVGQILYEGMGSKDQTGPDPNDPTRHQVSVRDNYYNHSIYTGWQHWGMGLGSPLLTSPIYNTNGNLYFYNNRVLSNHFGLSGSPTSELSYRLLLTLTRNWGTYDIPIKEFKQTYSLAEITYSPLKLKGWHFTASYGTDRGSLTGNNNGAMFVIRKNGLLLK
ncbi:capsule assembly Wzi family protein [uncultured Bacteroides sp.]|uniref:capsule assembly Wzi family protein n=1 Tax=uncultured Bacteroides sp. TaxID=162156 RepID=UPI002AA7EC33|nr:capsule assembly Wzi family protein [uncultured Bacteroides sp.]